MMWAFVSGLILLAGAHFSAKRYISASESGLYRRAELEG